MLIKTKRRIILFIINYLFAQSKTVSSIVGLYPSGVMVKAMGCGIVVSEFEHQSRYYVHF